MACIMATMFSLLVGLHLIQTPCTAQTRYSMIPLQLPNPVTEPSRYCYEKWTWYYTIVWMGLFGFIVVSQYYEYFTAEGYLYFCGTLALPLMVQPMLYPQACNPVVNGKKLINPDTMRPLHQRYSTKATLYLMTYSFIGNYWYTHYFYSVLKAKYTMPAHRLNDVPIAMFLATHFYFTTYHASISNGVLRYVDRSYVEGRRKQLLFWFTVLFLSYSTAYMETLTISSFPYYSFENRIMAYVWGSAFYGIYFIVSFPGFYYFDSCLDERLSKSANPNICKHVTLMDTFTTACGHGMIILCLLDFVRLYIGLPLIIGGTAFELTS